MALLDPQMALRMSGLANTAQSVGAATPQTQAIAQQAAAAYQASQPVNPFTMVDYGNYVMPTKGTEGYGVGYGTGLGGDAQTQQLFGKAPNMAGLWAMGFDQADPNFNYKLWEFHQDRMKNDPDYKNYVSQEASKQGYDLNNIQHIANASDWYYRDLARRMGQSNSFMDSTLGKILGTVATIGAGALGGPLAGGLVGGVTGGLSSGNVLGGLLGAAGGYVGAGGLGGANAVGGGLNGAINTGLSQGAQNAIGVGLAGAGLLNQSGGSSGNYSDQPQQNSSNPAADILLSGIPGLLNQPATSQSTNQTASQSLSIPTASAEDAAGLLGPGWGGKFDKFKSPYKNAPMKRKQFVNAFRSA